MTTRYAVDLGYEATDTIHVDMPEGKTWDDVSSYGAKWGTLTIKFKDGTMAQFEGSEPELDLKRPSSVGVYPLNKQGMVGKQVDGA